MWKFEFDAPVGTRMMKRFFGATTFQSDLWYSEVLKKWVPIAEVPDDSLASTHARCNSFKAFKRHLRKHPELRGLEVILASRFMGYDVRARWME